MRKGVLVPMVLLLNFGWEGLQWFESSGNSSLDRLDISQNQIGGSIPEEIYRLTNLQALCLCKNQLTGTISSWAGNWFDMIQLHLSHNLLTGSIPSTLTPLDSAFRSFSKWQLGRGVLLCTTQELSSHLFRVVASRIEIVNLKSNNLSGSIVIELLIRS